MINVQGVTIFLESKKLEKTVDFYTKVFDFRIKNNLSEHSVVCLENAKCNVIIHEKENPIAISFGLDISDTNLLISKINKYGNVEYHESHPYDSAHHEFLIYDNDRNCISLVNHNYK